MQSHLVLIHPQNITTPSDIEFSKIVCENLTNSGHYISIFNVAEPHSRQRSLTHHFWSRRANYKKIKTLNFAIKNFSNLTSKDAVIFSAGDFTTIEDFLHWTFRLSLNQPIDTNLIFRFSSFNLSRRELATIGQKIKSGLPFRRAFFFADTKSVARRLSSILQIKVQHLPLRKSSSFFSKIVMDIGRDQRTTAPSVTVDRLGPLAIQVSPFWGRVGSTAIFDSQARYLLQRGFIVFRIFFDQWPEKGPQAQQRLDKLLAENIEIVRPHFYTIVSRKAGKIFKISKKLLNSFKNASPVARLSDLFCNPNIPEHALLSQAARHAKIAVVNHIPHLEFAKTITSAPTILETHDIFSHLLNVHGIPDFVPRGRDSMPSRLADEKKIWKKANVCVNLASADHALISKVNKNSFFIKPYLEPRSLALRPWGRVIKQNNLSSKFHSSRSFDLMFWGDQHQGNVIGVQWFFKNVFNLSSLLKDSKILLVGRIAIGLPKHILDLPNVFVTNFVDQLDDFFGRTKLLVIPDQEGTGISIKMMEVAAVGLPFLSTANGLRSLNLRGCKIRIPRTSASFAREIENLLISQKARETRAATARKIYELNFSRSSYEKEWDQVLKSLDYMSPGRETQK